MKILHCADLHLDSKMTFILDHDRAKERKAELLHNFQEMISYAEKNRISNILIAGDMFDTKNISANARNVVYSEIKSHKKIDFYYLLGNHDNDNFLSNLEEMPPNLKLFSDKWTSYTLNKNGDEKKKIVLSGIELSKSNAKSIYNTLVLDSDQINIVMLHGQESESGSKDKTEVINLRELQNKGIDYLALGHIHSYKIAKLDGRGRYCYPGCLEGRGFDECGEHGFVVLDIDEKTGSIADQFVPFAKRKLYVIEADVTDCPSSVDMATVIQDALKAAECGKKDLIKIVLSGTLDVSSEKNISYIQSLFAKKYYYFKVTDATKLKIEERDYLTDESLKGEFVRTVLANERLSVEEKSEVIRLGLSVLNKEEVEV